MYTTQAALPLKPHYFALKNLVFWARSEFSGSAWRIAARVWSEL